MWTQKAAAAAACTTPALSSHGGKFVTGGGGHLDLQQQQQLHKQCRHVDVVVVVKLPVAVSKVGLLTDVVSAGGEKKSTSTKPAAAGCLELLSDNDVVTSGRSSSSSSKGLLLHHKSRVIVIAGPTAVGKSNVAIALAKQLDGEIISADSIQVYKHMNVGSAKTPVPQREGVRHHLLDIISPTEEYSASRFCNDAREATELVLARNRVPIVVGGTCNYLRWYMKGCKAGAAGVPTAPPKVSAAIEAEFRRFRSQPDGWEIAVNMLAQAGDPATAYSLAHNDWYHLRRALEVLLVSGQPLGAFENYALHHEWDYEYEFQCYFLYQHRAELYRWIDLRCEQMVADPGGLLSEASWLLDNGLLPDTSSASRGIGYQEAMEFLVECRKAGGMITAERFLAFLSAFQRVSRSLVKKQLTWFRSDQHSDVKQFHWIDASQPTDQILKALRKEYRRRPGYPSELSGSDARKDASYREAKILKYYETKNRIFNSSAAIGSVLRWVKQTQRDRRFARNAIRF